MRGDVMGRLVLRPYTIHELDQMRDALRVLCRAKPPVNGGSFAPDPAKVEDQLRTHMINGTDPADLIAAAVDKTINDKIAVVDRWRYLLSQPVDRRGRSVGELLLHLKKAINELERYKTLNGR